MTQQPASGWNIHIKLAPSAVLTVLGDSVTAIRIDDRAVDLRALPEAFRVHLHQLANGVLLDSLDDGALMSGGVGVLAQWLSLRHALDCSAAVTYAVVTSSHTRVTFAPSAPGKPHNFARMRTRSRLSRFAFLRRVGPAIILDSPQARGPVTIHDLSLLGPLFSADDWEKSESARESESDSTLSAVLALLHTAGLSLTVHADGTTDEDRNPHARAWEFSDLLLHMRSRPTRHDVITGGTYPWRGVLEPAPVEKPTMSEHRFVLDVPDTTQDIAFDRVVASRKSTRVHAASPITIASIGRFLWRGARRTDPLPDLRDGGYAVTHRVQPSGGACYPLELYLVLRDCAGAAPGLYHYRPSEHLLELLTVADDEVRNLSERYAWMMADGSSPQVVCIITARFLRTSWKYQGIAYSTILKDVGVLYESLYLAASAEGLAACAAGTGVGPTFSTLIGTDPLVESPVGEFVLGSGA